MIVNCNYCGSELWRKPYLVKKWKYYFCDRECQRKFNIKDIIMYCDLCGKQYSTKPYKLKYSPKHYCSHRCASKVNVRTMHNKNEINYNYVEIEPELLWALYHENQYSTIKISNLLNCGATTVCRKMELYDIPRREGDEITRNGVPWNKGKKDCFRKETLEKMSVAKIGVFEGEDNPNWRGGISFEPYGLQFNSKLKEQIRKRDNYTCQECGFTQHILGYKLHVHHIDYDKQNNLENNLVSLCRPCHTQTNFDRNDWTEYFKRISDLEKAVY